MSTAEATAARPAAGRPAGQLAAARRAPAAWLRLLRSELRLVFRRLRNLALLAALAALPVLLGIALRLAAPRGGGGERESSFISQLAGNGVFLAFIAITIMIALVLPLAVAVVSGDSVAGEAGLGTLRYLLTVPAGPDPAARRQVRVDRGVRADRLLRRRGGRRWRPGPRCSRSGR